MRKHTLPIVAMAVAAALGIAAGCGGGGGDQTASAGDETVAAPVKKAVFIKKATEVCNGLGDRLLARSEKQEEEGITEETGVEAENEAVRTVLVPEVEREIDELRELGFPKGDEKRLNAFYGALEEVMRSAEEGPQRFNQEVSNFEHPYAKPEKIATAYGIPNCSQP